ncbi:hypothetical protein TWF751_006681 [Orbilia oligospora]|nr:hypothetical protein TWF751_006681 [Orbilia oligospora]
MPLNSAFSIQRYCTWTESCGQTPFVSLYASTTTTTTAAMASKQLLGPRQPCQSLNTIQRGAIIAPHSRGDSNIAIARALRLQRTNTQKSMKTTLERGSGIARKLPGRLRKTS